MKTELEVIEGNLVISSEDGSYSMTLDVRSGEVLDFEYVDTNLQYLRQFVNKVYTRYNKFLNSEQVKDFIR